MPLHVAAPSLSLHAAAGAGAGAGLAPAQLPHVFAHDVRTAADAHCAFSSLHVLLAVLSTHPVLPAAAAKRSVALSTSHSAANVCADTIVITALRRLFLRRRAAKCL